MGFSLFLFILKHFSNNYLSVYSNETVLVIIVNSAFFAHY
ncbi:hypothetical protein FORMA_08580 [Formosa sp. Hel3_A1_48]|nr:hypothetical protein FORMA_08580 [Formosa sp. Hel3_A1_48]